MTIFSKFFCSLLILNLVPHFAAPSLAANESGRTIKNQVDKKTQLGKQTSSSSRNPSLLSGTSKTNSPNSSLISKTHRTNGINPALISKRHNPSKVNPYSIYKPYNPNNPPPINDKVHPVSSNAH